MDRPSIYCGFTEACVRNCWPLLVLLFFFKSDGNEPAAQDPPLWEKQHISIKSCLVLACFSSICQEDKDKQQVLVWKKQKISINYPNQEMCPRSFRNSQPSPTLHKPKRSERNNQIIQQYHIIQPYNNPNDYYDDLKLMKFQLLRKQ